MKYSTIFLSYSPIFGTHGTILINDDEKANLLNHYFHSIFTMDDGILPNFPSDCFPPQTHIHLLPQQLLIPHHHRARLLQSPIFEYHQVLWSSYFPNWRPMQLQARINYHPYWGSDLILLNMYSLYSYHTKWTVSIREMFRNSTISLCLR